MSNSDMGVKMMTDEDAMIILDNIFEPFTVDSIFSNGDEISPVKPTVRKMNVHRKVKYPEEVKFSFYGCVGQCNHHDGVIIIASITDYDKGTNIYGTAYCSPKDVYNKERGKLLAYNDMYREMKTVALYGKTHHTINSRIMSDIVANADCPSWAEDMVAEALCKHLVRAFNVDVV